MHIPKKLSSAIRELFARDKKDESKKERVFRKMGKIHSSGISNDLADLDFVDYGDVSTFRHTQDSPPTYRMISFIGTEQ